jgi:hypothetical protein
MAAGGLATAVSAIGATFGALLSPIGLVVAAVVGGTTAFATMTETGRAMASNLAKWFGELASIASASFRAIAGALAAGDISAAAEVLWTGLKLVWLEGTNGLREFWASYKTFFMQNMTELVFGAQRLFARMVAALKSAWANYSAFFKSAWSDMVNATTRAVLSMQKKVMEWLTGEEFDISIDLNEADARNAAEQARITAEENAALGRAGAERDAELAGIDAASAAAAEDRGAAHGRETAEIRAARERARAAWREATDAANAVAAAAESQRISAGEIAAEIEAGASAAMDGVSNRGTFNAANILGLQASSGSADEETAENTRRAAGHLARIDRNLGNAGALVVA